MNKIVSPTIIPANETFPQWWEEYGGGDGTGFDREGYDRYGFDVHGLDRAGWSVSDYQSPASRHELAPEIHNAADELIHKIKNTLPDSISREILDVAEEAMRKVFPETFESTGDKGFFEPPQRPWKNSVGGKHIALFGRDDVARNSYICVFAKKVDPDDMEENDRFAALVYWASDEDQDLHEQWVSAPTLVEISHQLEEVLQMARTHIMAQPFAVCLDGLADSDPHIVALPLAEFEKKQKEDETSPDLLGVIKAEDGDSALTQFSAQAKRSAVFDQWLMRGKELNAAPQP